MWTSEVVNAVVVLFIVQAHVAESVLEWRCAVVQRSCPYGTDLSSVWADADFLLRVYIIDTDQATPSDDLNSWFYREGGRPLVNLFDRFDSGIEDHSFKFDLDDRPTIFNSSWYIPFRTEHVSITRLAVRSTIRSLVRNESLPSSLEIGSSGESVKDSLCEIRVSSLWNSPSEACAPPLNSISPSMQTPIPMTSTNTSRLFRTPSLPDAFLIHDNSRFELVHSSDEFGSMTVLNLSQTADPIVSERDSHCQHPNGIRHAQSVREGLLVSSQGGVYLVRQGGSRVKLYSKCVDSIFVSQGMPLDGSLYGQVTFASRSNPVDLLYWTGEKDSFESMLDSKKRDFKTVFHSRWGDSNIQIISAEREIITGSTMVLVAVNNATQQRYDVIAFDNDMNWSVRGELPFSVQNISSSTPPFERIVGGLRGKQLAAASSIPLFLTSMELRRRSSFDLFVWGNALLLSRDAGRVFSVLFTEEPILTFSSSNDNGAFAFTTESRALYYGTIHDGRVYKVFSAASSITPVVFFDSLSHLRLLRLNDKSNAGATVSAPYEMEKLIQESLFEIAIVDNMHCPYMSIEFIALQSPHITRHIVLKNERNISHLPKKIFLNYGDVYEFQVIIVPAKHLVHQEDFIELGFLKNDDNLMNVSIRRERKHGFTGRVVFNVRLEDTKSDQFKPDAPGMRLRLISLEFVISNSSVACLKEDIVGDTIVSKTGFEMNVVSGCVPGYYLRLNPDLSKAPGEDCNQTPYGCFHFEADFHPVLELFDMLSENATQYKGFYSMIAIGGGLSPDSITPFDESSISDYNQGSKPIWSRLDASGETDNSILNMNSIISWVCGEGSPCFSVFPELPFSPAYYLQLRFISRSPERETYCSYESEVIVRVYGMNMDWGTTLTLAIGTSLFLFIMLLAGFFVNIKSLQIRRKLGSQAHKPAGEK